MLKVKMYDVSPDFDVFFLCICKDFSLSIFSEDTLKTMEIFVSVGFFLQQIAGKSLEDVLNLASRGKHPAVVSPMEKKIYNR